MTFLAAFPVGIDGDAVANRAPPHAAILEGYPDVLARSVQKVVQRIKLLSRAGTRPILFFQSLLDCVKIRCK